MAEPVLTHVRVYDSSRRLPDLPERPTRMLVTPHLAAKWLERNTRNRNLRQRLIDCYASDMREGRWQFNGDAIRFDRDGNILDGQHRLWASVTSDRSFVTLIVAGLDPSSQETIDIGAARTTADSLKLRGHDAYAQAGAIARLLLEWRALAPAWSLKTTIRHTNAEVIELVERDPLLQAAAKVAQQTPRRTVPLQPSVFGLAWYLLHEIEWDDADVFFERLRTGAELQVGHPILTLRTRLHERRVNRIEDALAMTFRAWNAYREHRTLTRVYGSDAPGGGEFPMPR